MKIDITRTNGSIAFELQPPAGFVTLVVSNAKEEVLWELEPEGMQAAEIIDAKMFTMRVPSSVVNVAKKIAPSSPPEYPAVSRIVYGQVPDGYRELAPASTLKPGEEYAVLVMGCGLDHGGKHFFG
ncbi:MAG TPA: hypothetical protein VF975_11125 [Thermoanaerobaculia bacterium]